MYASRTKRPPRTPLDEEMAAILKASGQHREGFRDHVIISLALGTGLREHEIAGLDVGDVSAGGKVLRRFQLRVFKRSRYSDTSDLQWVQLGDATYYKVRKWLETQAPAPPPERPLFVSKLGGRLSTRRIRSLWRWWQVEAGIARPYRFHELRHLAITKFRERTGDIRLTQVFARHSDIRNTTIYDHPSSQSLLSAVKDQPG